eukprot:6213907-Pleurochrysis_carterae.AAC.2
MPPRAPAASLNAVWPPRQGQRRNRPFITSTRACPLLYSRCPTIQNWSAAAMLKRSSVRAIRHNIQCPETQPRQI